MDINVLVMVAAGITFLAFVAAAYAD